jgi:deoxyguanosine kinase
MAIEIPYNYICIEGNIGSGKTSFTQMIHEEYQCQLILEEFNDNPFLPLFYQDKERYAFSVELFFMTERYKQLQQKLLKQDLFQKFTIADYSFVKSQLFARNNLIEEEYRLFMKLWNVLNASFPKPDILVYLHRDVETLKKYIEIRGREYEKLIESEYLQNIQNIYFEYFRNILSFPVVIIDINDIDFVANPKHYEALKHIISSDYRPGVHRISLIV